MFLVNRVPSRLLNENFGQNLDHVPVICDLPIYSRGINKIPTVPRAIFFSTSKVQMSVYPRKL